MGRGASCYSWWVISSSEGMGCLCTLLTSSNPVVFIHPISGYIHQSWKSSRFRLAVTPTLSMISARLGVIPGSTPLLSVVPPWLRRIDATSSWLTSKMASRGGAEIRGEYASKGDFGSASDETSPTWT